MEKKTAFYKACETIRYLCKNGDGFTDDKECPCLKGFDCPKDDEYYDNKSTCIGNMMECFQEQADITDGWDVVKEIIKLTDLYATPGCDCGVVLGDLIRLANKRLQEAWIEA